MSSTSFPIVLEIVCVQIGLSVLFVVLLKLVRVWIC